MKLSEKIDMFTGGIDGNTPAPDPWPRSSCSVFVDGCTDFLWDKAVPKFAFARITNIQSADRRDLRGRGGATWPTAKKIAHIRPTPTAATPSTTS